MERPAPSKFIKPQLAEPATLAHLRKIAQLEQTVKDLRGQLGEMAREQVSAHALREIIHGCADEPVKPPAWIFKKVSGHTTGIPLLFVSDTLRRDGGSRADRRGECLQSPDRS